MKVSDKVQSSNVKYVVNGKKGEGPISGVVTKMTSRVVIIDETIQVTPAQFKNNFELVADIKDDVVVDDVKAAVDNVEFGATEVPNDVEQKVDDKVEDAKQKEVVEEVIEPIDFAQGTSRLEQVKAYMAKGMTSPTKIARLIGMNQSYCQRLVSKARKEVKETK